MPYLDEQDLYDAIDLSKPWYHPDNIELAGRMPEVYLCPSFDPETRVRSVTTAYVAILGVHTGWPRSGKRKLADIVDGHSRTLALVESETYRIPWMSTADPGIEMIGPVTANGKTLLTNGPHQGMSTCVFFDVHADCLFPDCDFNALRAMLTIDGGDSPMRPCKLQTQGRRARC